MKEWTKAQRGMRTFLFIKRMNTEQNNKTKHEAIQTSADRQLHIDKIPQTPKGNGYLNMIPNQLQR
jgi:hypothetical protein